MHIPVPQGVARLTLACALLLAQAAVASPRIAPLSPSLKPAGSAELRDRFHEAVSRGLTAPDLVVVTAAEVRFRLATQELLLTCSVGSCLQRAASELRVDRIVVADIGIVGKQYDIKLRVLTPAGQELAHAQDTCDICTLKEAEETVQRTAAKLVPLLRAVAEAAPAPSPSGAARPAATPAASPGPSAAPSPSAVAVAPSPTPAPSTPAAAASRFPYRMVGFASLAAGVIGLAIGIPLLIIDGQPTCGLPDPIHSCPEVYNTGGGGGVALALGIGGFVAAGTMFFLDWRLGRKKQESTVRVAFRPYGDGGLIQAMGRF